MEPDICPFCGSDDVELPDTPEPINVNDHPGLQQRYVCNDGACQGQWDAQYVLVSVVNKRRTTP